MSFLTVFMFVQFKGGFSCRQVEHIGYTYVTFTTDDMYSATVDTYVHKQSRRVIWDLNQF